MMMSRLMNQSRNVEYVSQVAVKPTANARRNDVNADYWNSRPPADGSETRPDADWHLLYWCSDVDVD